MKGTILDFLKLAAEKPELAQQLIELAKKHDFDFTDEVSDAELEQVAGGQKINEAPDEPEFVRNKYFTGKILPAKDLEEEQKYPYTKPVG
jgi:hypothetical protein